METVVELSASARHNKGFWFKIAKPMRHLISKLLAIAFVVVCWNVYSQSTNTSLTFYVVHEEKIEGGRFIDTIEFPKLGYIAAKAELTITNIRNVCPQKIADHAIMSDGNGGIKVVPTQPLPALAVQLEAEDGKRFAALTERSVGKRLLVMLDDKPVTAPNVMCKIESGGFTVDFNNQEDLKKAQDKLKRLVR